MARNKTEAEEECEVKAIAQARGLCRLGPTRVQCTTKLKTGATTTTVSEWKQSKYGQALEKFHLQ